MPSSVIVDQFLLCAYIFCDRVYFMQFFNYNLLCLFIYLFRLTPGLLLVMGLLYFLPLLSSGPFWYERVDPEIRSCNKYWWRNILYISNWFGIKNIVSYFLLRNNFNSFESLTWDIFQHSIIKLSTKGIVAAEVVVRWSYWVPYDVEGPLQSMWQGLYWIFLQRRMTQW